MDGDGKLTDVTCNADTLTVENFKQQEGFGMEILCVGTPITDNGDVPAQNSCILICDGYPILNFYTDMAEWFYTMMDSPDEETKIDDVTSTGSIIFCHHV